MVWHPNATKGISALVASQPLDVLLDNAGVPDGVDTAWQPKHYLGAPVPGATMATVNLAHIVAAIEFVAAAMVEEADDLELRDSDALRLLDLGSEQTAATSPAPPAQVSELP